jgi:8-oxo-dGTP pyrophosphatase MutT (NUDIX family)
MYGPWQREAARVILIDERARVLLTSARDPDDGVLVWFAPGGSVEPGETIEQTARRELSEEIEGPSDYQLTGPVWTRRSLHTFDGRKIDLREWYFVSWIAAGEVRDVRETGAGAKYFEGWRWWTLDELSTHEGEALLAPRRIAALLPPLLRGELPTEPIDAGA